jgi:hypothetical protein
MCIYPPDEKVRDNPGHAVVYSTILRNVDLVCISQNTPTNIFEN